MIKNRKENLWQPLKMIGERKEKEIRMEYQIQVSDGYQVLDDEADKRSDLEKD